MILGIHRTATHFLSHGDFLGLFIHFGFFSGRFPCRRDLSARRMLRLYSSLALPSTPIADQMCGERSSLAYLETVRALRRAAFVQSSAHHKTYRANSKIQFPQLFMQFSHSARPSIPFQLHAIPVEERRLWPSLSTFLNR